MDGFYYTKNASVDPNIYYIMDNDSGYVSNNLDQETNSDSLLDNSTSTVDILRSFLPKPVYLSEDALLECPNIQQKFEEDYINDSPNVVIDSSVHDEKSCSNFPSFSSFQTDTDASDCSLVPIADPIYFDLNAHSSPSTEIPQECINDGLLMQSIEFHEEPILSVQQIVADELNKVENIISSSVSNPQPKNESSSSDEKSQALTPSKKIFHSSSENNVLTNVTNICDKMTQQAECSSKNSGNRRRCGSTSNDKENISQNEVFKTPSRGVKRKFIETGSPDLFSDDENSIVKVTVSPKIIEERFIHKLDHKLLKRVQKETSGVPPPPDLTITQFTVDDILQKLESNKDYFWTKEVEKSKDNIANSSKESNDDSSFEATGSILIDGNFEEAINRGFPQILHSRHYGLHHNRNKLSEEIEHLCDKYARRYIGIETQSTCCAVQTKYMSPNKRKVKQKWLTKSPGRRLSHLAKRRITFSSANLHAAGSSSAASKARQIFIDCKKLELLNHKKSPRKSPRKTPRKSPNKSPNQGRTPSSSAKKKLRMRFRLLSGDFKESTAGPSSSIQGSKRALFQSPDSQNKFDNILSNSSTSSCSSFNSDLNSRGINTKRSLFSSPNRIGFKSSLFLSPNKKSEFKNVSCFEKKRKRDETDENSSIPAKVSRSQSIDSRCSTNEFLFQSMSSKAKNENLQSSSQPGLDLSAAHKKKLQWAVYESLKHHNITTTHPQFKIFASVLARVTRRFILSSNIRLEGGTSERMFRIAKHHSYAVVKGKSVEEIMSEHNRNKARSSKPQGYVAPEDYLQCQNRANSAHRDSVLKDRINIEDSNKSSNSRNGFLKVESRIDRIRKVINFEDSR